MFISFPRTSTVPVTLTKLFIKSKKRFPELLAFPALDFHEEGNCAGIQNADALAKIDGRLFVVDKKWKWCPSKIWIFDLYDRKLGSEVHEFPRFINYIKTVNMDFGSMALYENRIDIYAFILDRYNQAVVVFSMLKKKWKIVRLRGFNSVSGIAVSIAHGQIGLFVFRLERNDSSFLMARLQTFQRSTGLSRRKPTID
ncbi:Hypothetical predicted protein [Cloeon dipterum]|uniref:Bee-milk protein n=1 Tax=Cloeon dipterum TaxID=197152 RepID=A0A8S1DVQ6_9INSE|nr:Hypothetical predicted protein [Cloeon dipterum]